MFYVYIGCLTFGSLYALLSAILGSHGFDHGDMGGAGAVDHNYGNSADMPSPLNPVVIASAIATFGASGIIAEAGLNMGEKLSLAFALAVAAIVGALVFFGVVKVLYNAQSNSNFSSEDLIGYEAEVFTPVPANGFGEIVYSMNGIRYTLPARSEQNDFIGRGEKVVIRNIRNHTAYVARRVTINELYVEEYEVSEDAEKDPGKEKENN